MLLLSAKDLPSELIASTSTLDLRRGEVLCRQGEPVRAVFVVLSGRVQLCGVTSDGKHVPLYSARAGEFIAEAALFAERYCSDVVAETRSSVRAFPSKNLRDVLRERPDLAEEFMSLQAKRCMSLRISLELRSLRTARERILQYIQVSAPAGSKTVKLDRTLKDLSHDLGLTHESLYRTLAQLIEEGVVTKTKTTLRLRQ